MQNRLASKVTAQIHKSKEIALIALLALLALLPMQWVGAAAGKNDTVVKGVVKDSSTGETIPFASISILKTDCGSVTNENGEFKIYLHPADSIISISAIGFNSLQRLIPHQPQTIFEFVAELTPAVIELKGIEIYSDGLTDAERIIMRAIKRKKEILEAVDNYSFKAYTKTIVSYKTKHDSTYQVAFITETASDGYWRRPDDYKEIIVARKQGATLLPEWNTFAVERIPNFNRNTMRWDGEEVPTPTAENALEIYRYWIQDTLYMDSVAIFYLGFEPKEDSTLLRGVIGIANKTYEVREVDVSRLSDIQATNQSTEVHYSQRFRKFSGDHWMPVDLHVVGEYPDDSTIWKLERFTAIQDYQIDTELPSGIFDRFRLEVAPDADEFDSTTWAQRQAIPLSERDSIGYQRTVFLKDSVLSNNTAIRIGFGVYQFNRRLNRFMDRFHLSSFSDWYHYNSVEGNYLGIGFKKKVYATGLIGKLSAGYSVSGSRWNYEISAGYKLDKYHETTIGLSLIDKVSPVAYQLGSIPQSSTFQTLAVKRDPENYLINKGWKARLSYRPYAKWQIETIYSNLTQSSIATGTDFTLRGSHDFRDNPSVTHGELRRVGVNIHYDSRDYERRGEDISLAFNHNSTQFSLSHERAGDEFLGGDFTYKKYYADFATKRHWFFGFSKLSLQYGYATGELTSQALFRLGPRRGLSGTSRLLKTIGSEEFFGDRYAYAGFSHILRMNPFKYLPLPVIRNFSGNLGFHGGLGWTDFNSRRSEFSSDTFADASQVYYEAGFGIAELLPVGTLWFSWQLSEFDTDKFKVTLAF